jgi:excisionase family DNA binding protein
MAAEPRRASRPTLLELENAKDGPTLTVGALAYTLGLSDRTVRLMVDGGDIRGVRLGRNYKVPWRSFRNYLFQTGVLPLRPAERAQHEAGMVPPGKRLHTIHDTV